MQAPNPGDILLGKYRVEEIIGVGGMGRVVKASHLYLQQPVAIKILLPELAESQSTVARFLREAQATVRLRSEHIARVMDVGTMPDGSPFMVMEFLEGHDLNQILRHHGPQQPQAVVDLILQACEGMAEAHAIGIVHRDIKPSNFFITRRPDGSSLLKILDFGISKTPAELSELTGAQTVVGTPTYMAPEQMVSARSTDPRSDIWSIGVVMYQLLSGRPPFEAETYAQLVLQVGTAPPAPLHVALPPGLGEIVLRCLEKDPNRRIQSVGELARVLAPYASDPMTAQQAAERAARILTTPRGSQPGFPLAGTAGGLSLTPPNLTPKSWSKTGGSSLSGSAGQFGTKVIRGGRGLVIGGVATLCVLAGIGGFFVASSLKKSPRPAASVEEPAAARKMKMVGPAATQPATGTTNKATAAMAGSTPGAIGSATSEAAKTATGTSEPAKTAAGTSGPAKTAGVKTAAKSDDAKTAVANPAAKSTDAKTAAKGDDAKTTVANTAAKGDDAKTTVAKTAAKSTDAKATAANSRDAKTTAAKTAAKTDDAKATAAKTKAKTKSKQAKSKKSDDLDDLFDDRK